MRRLTSYEKMIVLRARKRSGLTEDKRAVRGLEVGYRIQGNFTVAILQKGKCLYLGVAKRMPTDREDEQVGKNVALFRAMQHAIAATNGKAKAE